MTAPKIILLTIVLCISACMPAQNPKKLGYVIATDYMKADGKKDVSDVIQKLIDSHPNRTIYFPDGVYLIGHPIATPAHPQKSVALQLSNYAIIRATDDWNDDEAMIRLGGKDAANDIRTPGSNYYLDGGIIDGNKKAIGISIDSGRETVIRNTSIKNVTIGIHIKHGANSGSSDSDIHDVNIVGICTPNCIGVWVEGYDNTFTNMRIGGVHTGMKICSAGNSLRNIHPLYYGSNNQYETSCGFYDEKNNNWYDFCYSDEFATGFCNTGGRSIYHNCFAYWYSKRGTKHTVFKTTGRFNANVTNMTAGMDRHNETNENVILETAQDGGTGRIFNLNVSNYSVLTNTNHEKYMK
ncbi:MAG: hypothetical protein ILA34_00310 [Bacteroidaceae bacterium]|nr:hypothetical protein [Bacteroidaceae bacterium]